MLVKCTKCKSKYEVKDLALKKTKVDKHGRYKLHCTICNSVFYVVPPPPKDFLADILNQPDVVDEENNDETLGTMYVGLHNKPKLNVKPQNLTKSGRSVRLVVPSAKKLLIFGNYPFFDGIDANMIKRFASYLELYRISKEVSLFVAGDQNVNFGLILKGEIKLFDGESNATDKPLVTFGSGGILGGLSLFDGQPRISTAITSEETYIIILTQSRFKLLGKNAPYAQQALQHGIVQAICKDLRDHRGNRSDVLMEKPESMNKLSPSPDDVTMT